MNTLSHRLFVAPMTDRNDLFSRSTGCDAACAERVHEVTSSDYAGVRRNANLGMEIDRGKVAPTFPMAYAR
jgi:hypothetical protein